MACASTPTPLAAIEHFLGVIERTDLHAMVKTAERFFAVGERCAYLELFDDACDTHATFYHLDATYEWFEQLGSLDWGSQQLVPSGEISVLPLFHGSYDPSKRPHVMGEITLQGYPIVHSGRPAFLLEDQARIYGKLALLEHYPVIATVEHGVIRALRATHKKAKPAVDMLQRLFDVDSRYRSIWGIGFGINGNHTMYPGNVGMNEVHGGAFGAIHWGLGLTPWTQYHIDIICPGTRVAANTGEILIGPPPRTTAGRLSGPVGYSGMRRNQVDACPCTKSLPS
jgi:limonene-1,2-epoxide hydrolase